MTGYEIAKIKRNLFLFFFAISLNDVILFDNHCGIRFNGNQKFKMPLNQQFIEMI